MTRKYIFAIAISAFFAGTISSCFVAIWIGNEVVGDLKQETLRHYEARDPTPEHQMTITRLAAFIKLNQAEEYDKLLKINCGFLRVFLEHHDLNTIVDPKKKAWYQSELDEAQNLLVELNEQGKCPSIFTQQ